MSSQTYQADDGQLMQDHDQVVLGSHLTEPEGELAVAEPDLAEPDAQLGEPDADQTQNAGSTMLPVRTAPQDGPSAASLASDYPGVTADSDGATETTMADSSSGTPEPVSPMFMTPEPDAESPRAAGAASMAGPWNEIQAMFVDDPRASVERAAGLADDRVEQYIESVRERQRSLRSAWQADDAGTEELRVALQHYRTFGNSLEDLPDQC